MGAFPNNTDERAKLEDEIKKLEAQSPSVAKPKLPVVTLKEMSYTAPTDAQIDSAASSSLEKYRTDNIASIESDAATDQKELTEKRDEFIARRDKAKAELDAAYAQAADNIDNDVLRRGIGRSSIAVGQKAELESEYAGRRADMSAEYGKAIADLDAQIGSISSRLSKALDDFNLAYAAKLNEAVAKLKAERAQKIEEVEKYNNDVRYKQAKLDEGRAKAESALYSDALSQREKENSSTMLSPERRDELYKAVYDKMDAFLGAMSQDEARLEIKNHTFYRSHLSDYYYYKLLDKYGR